MIDFFNFYFTSIFFSFHLVKYNQITQGTVEQDQFIRDVQLYTPDGQPTTLFSQISANKPLVILAGSTS